MAVSSSLNCLGIFFSFVLDLGIKTTQRLTNTEVLVDFAEFTVDGILCRDPICDHLVVIVFTLSVAAIAQSQKATASPDHDRPGDPAILALWMFDKQALILQRNLTSPAFNA